MRLVLRNSSAERIGPLDCGQPLLGSLLNSSLKTVGGYSGAIAGTGRVIDLAPGDSASIWVIFGTASIREDLGYVLPPGRYWLRVRMRLHHGPGTPLTTTPAPLKQITIISEARNSGMTELSATEDECADLLICVPCGAFVCTLRPYRMADLWRFPVLPCAGVIPLRVSRPPAWPAGLRPVPAKGDTGRVDAADLDPDPLRQLSLWLDEARAAGQPMPEAMTIATATSQGIPSARLVVLRSLRGGLVFFTDCDSDKGADLAANPHAAAVLHWHEPAHRQVRVTGPTQPVSNDEADQYWTSRAPAARLTAAASRQSRVLASRTALEEQAAELARRHPGGAGLPRPPRWGGFRLLPSRVEFWQESPDGLHDRIRYRPHGTGWITERLSP